MFINHTGGCKAELRLQSTLILLDKWFSESMKHSYLLSAFSSFLFMLYQFYFRFLFKNMCYSYLIWVKKNKFIKTNYCIETNIWKTGLNFIILSVLSDS